MLGYLIAFIVLGFFFFYLDFLAEMHVYFYSIDNGKNKLKKMIETNGNASHSVNCKIIKLFRSNWINK